jgi:Prokaryotic RING finger family 1
MVGRTCPYCRFAFDEGASVIGCPVCHAVHHTDCWQENNGCAVALCAGGPSMADSAEEAPTTVMSPPTQTPTPPPTQILPPSPPPPTRPASPQPPPPVVAPPPVAQTTAQKPPMPPAAPPPGPPPAAAPPPWPAGRKPWTAFVPAMIAGLILLGGATAAALVLTEKHHTPEAIPVETTSSYEEYEPEETTSEYGSEESPEGYGSGGAGTEDAPEETTEQTYKDPEEEAEEEVKDALQRHFQLLVEGEYTSAWDDLSPSLTAKVSQSRWEEEERNDDLQSFHLALNVSITGSHSAEAEVIHFTTHALGSGCHKWSGSWEMVKQYGSWLINASGLERGSC